MNNCSLCGNACKVNFINDLDDLVNILDDFFYSNDENEDNEDEDEEEEEDKEEGEPLFDEDTAPEFVENTLLLMDEFIQNNPNFISDPTFHENFDYEIKELVYNSLENLKKPAEVWYKPDESFKEEIDTLLEYVFDVFFTTIYPCRSFDSSIIINPLTPPQKTVLKIKLDKLKAKPQPAQRTKEWYEFRYQLITASNAYKAFDSQSAKNQLIYEKCHPLKTETENVSQVNINTSLHWGQMCEPLSVMFYERDYCTKVDDFGCIQHDTYKFLGASPDGINVDPTNNRYGRMLEIKNIVNRPIDGIPKKEYWIQTQLQMETCDLDECDFLETKFIKYQSIDEYDADDTEYKCLIMYFANKDGNPKYVYQPLEMLHCNPIQKEYWQIQQMHEGEKNGLTWILNYYLKLETISCVLVPRNKIWFNAVVKDLAEIWRIIEKERVDGYSHRAAIKKEKVVNTLTTNVVSQCLLKINKETGKVHIN